MPVRSWYRSCVIRNSFDWLEDCTRSKGVISGNVPQTGVVCDGCVDYCVKIPDPSSMWGSGVACRPPLPSTKFCRALVFCINNARLVGIMVLFIKYYSDKDAELPLDEWQSQPKLPPLLRKNKIRCVKPLNSLLIPCRRPVHKERGRR